MPEGLLEEVKEHLDHMLNFGAITPSNSVWSNAVVLVWKTECPYKEGCILTSQHP